MSSFHPTARTTVRRLAKRGVYDREVVYGILDEAFICHVGFVTEHGPVVLPTGYGRDGDRLYLHGSIASHLLTSARSGSDLCISVTLVDGLVMARSAFHHSMNYRSVVIFGKAQTITDPDLKRQALRCVSEHIAPGRWDEVRPPTDSELKATAVVAIPLEEASAKVRNGGPVDDADDYTLPTWAGVIPLAVSAGVPVADGKVADGVALPPSAVSWGRRVARPRIS